MFDKIDTNCISMIGYGVVIYILKSGYNCRFQGRTFFSLLFGVATGQAMGFVWAPIHSPVYVLISKPWLSKSCILHTFSHQHLRIKYEVV